MVDLVWTRIKKKIVRYIWRRLKRRFCPTVDFSARWKAFYMAPYNCIRGPKQHDSLMRASLFTGGDLQVEEPVRFRNGFTSYDLAHATEETSKWSHARQQNGQTLTFALLVSLLRLCLWHLFQPMFYFVVFYFFRESLLHQSKMQYYLAWAVAFQPASYASDA